MGRKKVLPRFHAKIGATVQAFMGDEKMTVNERIKIIRTENNLTLEKFGESRLAFFADKERLGNLGVPVKS